MVKYFQTAVFAALGLLDFASGAQLVCAAAPQTNPPSSLRCGSTGKITTGDSALIFSAKVPGSTSNQARAACRDKCLIRDQCVTFSIDYTTYLCKVYSKGLDPLGFTPAKNTIHYFRKACFTYTLAKGVTNSGFEQSTSLANWVPFITPETLKEPVDYSLDVARTGHADSTQSAHIQITTHPSGTSNTAGIQQDVFLCQGKSYIFNFAYRLISTETTGLSLLKYKVLDPQGKTVVSGSIGLNGANESKDTLGNNVNNFHLFVAGAADKITAVGGAYTVSFSVSGGGTIKGGYNIDDVGFKAV